MIRERERRGHGHCGRMCGRVGSCWFLVGEQGSGWANFSPLIFLRVVRREEAEFRAQVRARRVPGKGRSEKLEKKEEEKVPHSFSCAIGSVSVSRYICGHKAIVQQQELDLKVLFIFFEMADAKKAAAAPTFASFQISVNHLF